MYRAATQNILHSTRKGDFHPVFIRLRPNGFASGGMYKFSLKRLDLDDCLSAHGCIIDITVFAKHLIFLIVVNALSAPTLGRVFLLSILNYKMPRWIVAVILIEIV